MPATKIRPQIGSIEGLQDPIAAARMRELKNIVEMITGRTPNKAQIVPLGPNATLAGVINKVNEIIDQLQK